FTPQPTRATSRLSLHDALPIPQRGHAPMRRDALETGDDRHPAILEALVKLGGVDLHDPRRAMGVIGADRHLPARKAARLDTHFRSEEHTSELQSRENLVCRLLL